MEQILTFNTFTLKDKVIERVASNGEDFVIFFRDETFLSGACDSYKNEVVFNEKIDMQKNKSNASYLRSLDFISEKEMMGILNSHDIKINEELELAELKRLMDKYKDKI